MDLATETGRRVALRRVYREYAEDAMMQHMMQGASNVVAGVGTVFPEVVFLGEAPGRQEDKHGQPFVGPAGRLLNDMLDSVGLNREEVFITNSVKVRPVTNDGRNRTPSESEIEKSAFYVKRELYVLGYPPVVLLGSTAVKSANRWAYPYDGAFPLGEWVDARGVKVLRLYHPAYGLYQHGQQPAMFDMFKKVREVPA